MKQIAYVRWFDSALWPGLCEPADVDGFTENESCGLLLWEREDAIAIALDRCIDTGDLRNCLCIPRVNIRSIRTIEI